MVHTQRFSFSDRKFKLIEEGIDGGSLFFQIMVLMYNIFLLFKIDKVLVSEYRWQILAFRLKCAFITGKIIRTVKETILKIRKVVRKMAEFECKFTDSS